MTDGNRPIAKGEIVRDFVLLPDRGNLVHPAHRFGDQMIAIHLREGDAVSFSPMALVWVWGTLQASAGDPAGSSPLLAALNWVQGTLLGNLATTAAVIAVALIGYLMLTGRFDWRRGIVVLVGIFIIFGAVTIVAGIRSLAGGV